MMNFFMHNITNSFIQVWLQSVASRSLEAAFYSVNKEKVEWAIEIWTLEQTRGARREWKKELIFTACAENITDKYIHIK